MRLSEYVEKLEGASAGYRAYTFGVVSPMIQPAIGFDAAEDDEDESTDIFGSSTRAEPELYTRYLENPSLDKG